MTMSHLLIRDLDVGTIERLELRAQRSGRSLQEEVKAILRAAVNFSMSEARSVAEQWQYRLTLQNTREQVPTSFRDSAETIRADRER
jgi:plasmid stability protein